MSPTIATGACGLVILALFLFDRDRKTRMSVGLWIPIAWLSICASRMVSQWLGGVDTAATPEQVLEGNTLDALIFGGLLAGGLMVLSVRRRRVRTFLRVNGPLFIFFAYCLVSVLWSDTPFVAFKRWTKAFGDVVMVLIVLTDPEPAGAVRRLLARTGFLLIPLSILLIRYYPSLGRQYRPWSGEVLYSGVAMQKNGLGYVCLLFGLGSLWYLLEAFRSGRWTRPSGPLGWTRPSGPLMAQVAILAMALYLFRMADSATSFICFLIGGGFIMVTSRALARRPAAVHLLVGSVLFVVLYGALLNPGAGLLEVVGRDATLTGRTEIWKVVLSMNVNPWVGAGYESFWGGERLKKIWGTEEGHMNQAHNGYLEIFLNLGWIGVALLSFVMAWGYRNVVRSLRGTPVLGRLRLAFFVVAAVYNLTEHAFRELNPVWIVFLLAVTVVPEVSRRAAWRARTSDVLRPGGPVAA